MRAKIDLISIVSADLPAMRDFYRDVMGFAVQLELGEDYVEFESEGVRFANHDSGDHVRSYGWTSWLFPRRRGSSSSWPFRAIRLMMWT